MIRPILFLIISILAGLQEPAHAISTFRETLDAHFQAVVSRDIARLETTLTRREALTLILPNGKRTTTRAAFLDFHRAWFADAGWTMRFEVIEVVENRNTAIAIVRTRYEEPVAAKPYWSESWLTLTFRKEQGRWRLFHDQNTRIGSSDAPAAN